MIRWQWIGSKLFIMNPARSKISPNRSYMCADIYITLVLLLGYCVGSISSLPWAESCSNDPRPPKCPDDCDQNKYYLGSDGMCKMCLKCGPGEELDKPCGNGRNGDAACKPCEEGHFSSEWDYECIPCRICTNTEELNTCTPTGDRECGDCLFGYFRGSTAFFDPNACPDSCEHNDPSEPHCREWWEWKARQQSATESPPVVPQDAPDEVPNIQETVIPQADPQQNPIDPENPADNKMQIIDNANEPAQQAALRDDATVGEIPYVTIIIALATTLVIVIIVFSVALCLVYFRRNQPPKSKSWITRGYPLPESPLLPRSGGTTPDSTGSPETGQKLSNHHHLPPGLPAGARPWLIRPSSLASSSGVESHLTEASSAESTPKMIPKTSPYHRYQNNGASVHVRSEYHADNTPRVPCNGNQGQTEIRRRSVSLPPEEFAQLRRRSSLAGLNTDIGNGRHVNGNGRKEPEAALFSEESEIDADQKDKTAIREKKSDRPKSVPNEPQVPAGNAVSTTPGQVERKMGIDGSDFTTAVDREATQGRAAGNHEKQRAPANTTSMNIHKPTESAAHIHITFSDVNCRKVQIGDEHHHNQETEPLQLGNVEDHEEDRDSDSDTEELDNLLCKS